MLLVSLIVRVDLISWRNLYWIILWIVYDKNREITVKILLEIPIVGMLRNVVDNQVIASPLR